MHAQPLRRPRRRRVRGHGGPLTIRDPIHAVDDVRFATIGVSRSGRTLVVVHADRGDNIRIISARAAGRRERQQYEEE
ncbi:MAG: BrnT family toxin [Candidatus Binatia bacterium]